MLCGFQPLFDRLLYIRHLAFCRPAISEPVDPILCWNSFYFAISNGQVVYATDKKPSVKPTVSGMWIFVYSPISFISQAV